MHNVLVKDLSEVYTNVYTNGRSVKNMAKQICSSITKWGNSLGVRIPKTIVEIVGLKENDRLGIKADGINVVLTKIKPDMPKSIDELFAGYKGSTNVEELDWGEPKGDEIW